MDTRDGGQDGSLRQCDDFLLGHVSDKVLLRWWGLCQLKLAADADVGRVGAAIVVEDSLFGIGSFVSRLQKVAGEEVRRRGLFVEEVGVLDARDRLEVVALGQLKDRTALLQCAFLF